MQYIRLKIEISMEQQKKREIHYNIDTKTEINIGQ